MQRLRSAFLLYVVFAGLALVGRAQDQENAFRWVDFHSEKDQTYIIWVTRALDSEKWTAIREIGVQYDAALVVTTQRSAPDASPATDTFEVWSVSLKTHAKTPLLKGAELHWLDWMQFTEGGPRDLAAVYQDCRDCNSTTYFTVFHYDFSQHIFVPRWLRGGQTIPLRSDATPAGVDVTQVSAVLAEPTGRAFLATWAHYDHGKDKDPEDFLYRYDLDPFSRLERTQLVSGKEAEVLKQRLCRAQGTPALTRGQDSMLCQALAHPRPVRKPVTTPPANAQGRSVPPGGKK